MSCYLEDAGFVRFEGFVKGGRGGGGGFCAVHEKEEGGTGSERRGMRGRVELKLKEEGEGKLTLSEKVART